MKRDSRFYLTPSTLTPAIQRKIIKDTMKFRQIEVLQLVHSSTNSSSKSLRDGEISETLKMDTQEVRFHLTELRDGGFIKLLTPKSFEGEYFFAMGVTPRGMMVLQGKLTLDDREDARLDSQIFNVTNQSSVGAQQFGNYNTLNVSQQTNLAEAAVEIQQILSQLEQSYPTTTLVEKAVIAEQAIARIESNPTVKAKVIGALRSAGVEAFKEAVDHPLVNILMAGIEGWREPG